MMGRYCSNCKYLFGNKVCCCCFLLFKLSALNSNFALILGCLNPALNNPALAFSLNQCMDIFKNAFKISSDSFYDDTASGAPNDNFRKISVRKTI